MDTGLKEYRELQEAIKEAGEGRRPEKKKELPKENTVHSLLNVKKDEDGDDDDVRAAKSNRFYDHEKAF